MLHNILFIFLINFGNQLKQLKQKNNKMKKFQEIKDLLSAIEGDAQKFYSNGNNAAGTRVRKAMQDIKSAAQAIRVEIQELKNKQQ